MKPVFPVKLGLNNDLIVNGDENPFMISDDPDFGGLSGYDENGDRFTNIVGFNGSDLLKRCTNKSCREKIMPSTLGFGASGRNSYPKKDMRRDQSQCIECRNKKTR